MWLLVVANALAVISAAWAGGFSDSTPRWSIPPTKDPVKAVTAIAIRQYPGWFDDKLTPVEMSERAVDRPLYTTCGPVSAWAVELLKEAGFTARLVMVMTLDKWNATDNGHTFVEVRQRGGWVAYDIHRKVRWTDDSGRGLSMVEWIDRVPSHDYRIVPLLAPVDGGALRRQDARYAQVPFVRAGRWLWFPSQGRRTASILKYSSGHRVLPRDRWLARFS